MLTPPQVVFDPSFGEKSSLYKNIYIYISFSSRRFQFYAAFRLIESTCIASGLGFNGFKDGKAQWDRIIGGFAWICETECNPAVVLKVNYESNDYRVELELFDSFMVEKIYFLQIFLKGRKTDIQNISISNGNICSMAWILSHLLCCVLLLNNPS